MSPPVPPRPNPGFWIPQATDYFRQFDDLFDTGTRGRDTQRNGVVYFTTLLLPSEERKSMENMAEKLPGIPEHRLRHFATYSPWDYRDVQIRMAQILGRTFASPQGVLALDDTGIPKQGRVSVGVGHQYMGVLGKVANGQDAVSLQYVLPDFTFYPNLSTFLLGMELYLPQEWVEDPKRRERAHIPEEVAFRTKWQIGLEFLDRARALKLPHRAVVGDSGFSRTWTAEPDFRREMR